MQSKYVATRRMKNFITPKLVAALDRCQLGIRNFVYILQATVESIGHNIGKFLIYKTSIQGILIRKRKEYAETMKTDFNNNVSVIVHWMANYYLM